MYYDNAIMFTDNLIHKMYYERRDVMSADENVKEALEKLEKMGYDIEEYDQGYIACILDRSKIQDSKGKENEEK